jgi:hypothetical protein
MLDSSAENFKKGLDKAFTKINLNKDTMTDLMSAKQGMKEEDVTEKWTEKYKKSIDCSKPKGFSQRAHCDGRKKKGKSEATEATGSGSSGAYSGPVFGGDDAFWERSRSETPKLKESEVEKVEATASKGGGSSSPMFAKSDSKKDWKTSRKTQTTGGKFVEESEVEKVEATEATGSGSSGAYSGPVFGGDDAFWERSRSETPKLKESEVEKVEATEATGSGSVGGYSSPAMWAKSTKKKDWGPSRKTQYPGGKFVSVKKKCTKFPYCNQGDINALNISKNEAVAEAIKNVSKKLNIGENVIKSILEHEYEKLSKRTK